MEQLKQSVLRVGDGGRGFVVASGGSRYVVTAAHCWPREFEPEAHAAAFDEEHIRPEFLARLGEPPSIAAQLQFYDPIADLAVLSAVDSQNWPDEADAFDDLVDAVEPFVIKPLQFIQHEKRFPSSDGPFGDTFLSPPRASAAGYMLSLDNEWFRCRVGATSTLHGYPRACFIESAEQQIQSGMSGSPIVTADGAAVGVVCVSGGVAAPNPYLFGALPGWLIAAPLETRVIR